MGRPAAWMAGCFDVTRESSPLTLTSHVYECVLCLQRVAVPLDHPRARTLRRYRQCPECDARLQEYLAGVRPIDETWPDGVLCERDGCAAPTVTKARIVGYALIACAVIVASAFAWSLILKPEATTGSSSHPSGAVHGR